jgi:hypothetical protein
MTTTKPTSTNFDDQAIGGTPQWPFTVNGLVFEGANANGYAQFIPYAMMGNSGVTGVALLLNGTNMNGGTDAVTFHSVSLADNFQLLSLYVPGASDNFTISGYNDGVLVTSDTIVLGQADTTGSVSYAINNQSGLSGGVLTFSSAWAGIDTVTFNRTLGGGFGIILDDIELKTASIGLAASSESGASVTDNITNDHTPLLTGNSDANSTIEIYLDGGSTPASTVQSDANGDFSVTDLDLQDGTYVVSARVQGAGSDTASVTITIDTHADAPAGLALEAGTLASDYTPTITGTAEANAEVTLYEGTTVVGTATADAQGDWEITTGALDDGDHVLKAVQQDVAGNVSVASAALTVTVATGRPGTPMLADASDSGAKGDRITNVTTPTLTGTAAANATVFLMEGGAILGQGTADADGKWSIAPTLPLLHGDHVLHAAIVDPGTAPHSAAPGILVVPQFLDGPEVTITIDTVAPASPAVLALADASDSGAKGDGKTNVATPTVTGTADAHATVTLYDGARALGTAQADGNGDWSIRSASLAKGVHALTAVQSDVAGNVSPAGAPFSVTIEARATTDTGTTVDGVKVDTRPVTLPGGGSGTSVTVPVVTPGRVEQSGAAGTADIPLSSQGGTAVVTAQVHTGTGLSASGGVSQGADAALKQLIATINATGASAGSADMGGMTGGGGAFLSLLPSSTALLVQAVKLNGDGNADFVGGTGSGTPVAIVVDGSQLPAGGAVTLKDIPFAAVFGAMTVSGTTQGQILTGDGAGQTFIVSGGAGGSVLAGGGTDVLQFGTGANTGGNPAVSGGAAPATAATTLLHGGSAADTAVFKGAAADYTVEQHDGYLLVASKAAPEQVAKVVNVETLRFDDATVTVENRDALSTLAGLYENVLGRQADVDGFAYWAGVEAKGTSLGAIALQLITSAEGVAAFGALNGDAAHDVAILYQGIFNRAPDAAGQAWWAGQVAGGTTLEAVADAMTQSAEIVGHRIAATDWNFAV